MSTHKRIDLICVVVLVCTLLLTILFMNGELLGIQKIVDEDAERNSDSVYFTANDLAGDWDASNPTAAITLNGDSAKVSGRGAYANGSTVTITGAGKYVVSGELTDGSIVVDAYQSSKVWILLDGVEISCSDGPALWVEEADKVFLTLEDGTENVLSSGAEYSAGAVSDGADGTIFAHDDLTINGSGSLTVNAAYQHGIAANDDLVITGGTISVTSETADGIRANDSLRICNADITVAAGDDGLVANNEEEGQGWLYLESGSVTVTSGDDAIHTAGDITIDGGEILIAAGDDGIHSDTAITINGGEILIEECYEGIEAVTIDMTGGDVTIYPEDDGFNANGGSGGFGMMGGGMDGQGGFGGGRGGFGEEDSSSDGAAAESADGESAPEFDGSMPEMDESGSRPEMPDGEAPSGMPEMGDDGSMPDFDGSMPEMSGDNTDSDSSAQSEETYINISGGTITIINEDGRDADGLDSNGDITISGGDIRISLTNSGSNSAIDYGSESGGVCEISGGTVIACGSYSMAESFDASSAQCSVLYNFSSGAEAGSALSLEDGDGNVLLSWEVPCSFSSANISCPEMAVGGTYKVVIGGQEEEITLEETSASFGDAASTMFGGMNRQGGGMQMRGGRSRDSESSSSENGSSAESGQDPGGDFDGSRPERPDGEGSGEGFGGPGGDFDGSRPERPDGEGSGEGFGGPGGFNRGGDSETQDSGSMPEFDSEPPEMPDGEAPGGMPETDGGADDSSDSSRPTPPDGDAPEMSGAPEDGFSPEGEDRQSGETSQEETVEADAGTLLWDLSGETWIWLGISAAVLLAGLFFGIVFKRR